MRLLMVSLGFWSPETASLAASGDTLKLVFAAAFMFGLVGLGIAGIVSLRHRTAARQAADTKADTRETKLQATEAQLDQELALVLRFMRTYVDANDNYSKSLAQVHKNLPSLAKPEQVRTMVRFLIAENEKMQRDTSDLRNNLEQSRSQIEKLRWNLAEAQELGLRDPLTEVSNRRCFDINLAKEITEAHTHKSAMCLVWVTSTTSKPSTIRSATRSATRS